MLSVIPSEISQESNASDPVDWIVEVDSSTEADEPDEVDGKVVWSAFCLLSVTLLS
jgi:hypothetical protein